jgi:hypothetical protein
VSESLDSVHLSEAEKGILSNAVERQTRVLAGRALLLEEKIADDESGSLYTDFHHTFGGKLIAMSLGYDGYGKNGEATSAYLFRTGSTIELSETTIQIDDLETTKGTELVIVPGNNELRGTTSVETTKQAKKETGKIDGLPAFLRAQAIINALNDALDSLTSGRDESETPNQDDSPLELQDLIVDKID